MIKVLNMIVSFAGHSALLEGEQGRIAREWAWALIEFIPEHRLMDSLKRAVGDHSSSFRISIHELQAAWNNINREELERMRNSEASDADRIANCKYASQHIARDSIDVSDAIVEYKDFLNFGGWVELPCAECRPTAFGPRREDHKRRNADKLRTTEETAAAVNRLAAPVLNAVAMRNPLPETAEEILMRAKRSCTDIYGFKTLESALAYIRNSKGTKAPMKPQSSTEAPDRTTIQKPYGG